MGQRFLEMRTAKAWGIRPSEWDTLDGETKAWMMAYDQASGQMESWEAETQRKKTNQQRNR